MSFQYERFFFVRVDFHVVVAPGGEMNFGEFFFGENFIVDEFDEAFEGVGGVWL